MSTYDPLDPEGDPLGPPAENTVVFCLHCGEIYDSYRIEWRILTSADGKQHGFWCCPIEGCGGAGFGCDIFPVDREYRDEHGHKMWVDDAEEGDEDFEEEENQGNGKPHGLGEGHEEMPF